MTIEEVVYGYESKNEKGLTGKEIYGMLETHYPKINMDKFNAAMTGITCTMENGEFVFYHCDVCLAIHCGLENRSIKPLEFD